MSELKVDILQEVANSGAFSINTMDLTHTPMWYGKLGADQTITRATDTTVTPFTGGSTITEPSTCFDGTTFTVPSSDDVSYAGAYYIFAQIGSFPYFHDCYQYRCHVRYYYCQMLD